MRISDWSSDVCSSDLSTARRSSFLLKLAIVQARDFWPISFLISRQSASNVAMIPVAASRVGVMVAMAASGRMMEKIDPRLMVFAGFVMMALSLWYMTGWSLEMDWHPVVWTGLPIGR